LHRGLSPARKRPALEKNRQQLVGRGVLHAAIVLYPVGTMTSLPQALTLEPRGAGFVAHIAQTWAQGRATFGGLVAALGARAMKSERPLRTLYVHFVGPVAPGEVLVTSEVLRSGKSVEHWEATLRQGGSVVARVLGAFGAGRVSDIAIAAPAPPPLGARADTPVLPYIEGMMPNFTKHFEFAWPLDRLPFAGAKGPAELGGWVRCPSAAIADPALVLCLVDAWPAATLRAVSGPVPSSSITWKIDFGTLAFEPTSFLRYESKVHMHADGYSTVECDAWTEEGVHVARASQLVAVFA
jgi:acyl-CoA thioesterase